MDRDSELAKIENAERAQWLRQASRRYRGRDAGPLLALNTTRRRFEQEGPISLGSGSVQMRWMFAWVHANVTADRLAAVLADFETARLRILNEEAGRVAAAERWPVPEVLRPYVDERADETFDDRLCSLAQLAGCDARETEAMVESLTFAQEQLPGARVLIRPRKIEEVAKAMAPTKRHGMPPAITSVETWLASSRRKLRVLFGVTKEDPEGDV